MFDGYYTLSKGHQGTDVLRLQTFLIDVGVHLEFGADGDFGPDTAGGVRAFQSNNGLAQTGVFDAPAISAALDQGYSNTRFTPGLHPENEAYPSMPGDLSSPDWKTAIGLFGEFNFRSAADPDNPGRIIIEDGWVGDNIITQPIPQMHGMIDMRTNSPRIMPEGEIRCHRLAAPKFLELFAAWQEAELMDRVIYYVGCFSARLKKGRTSFTKKNLSNHSWGAAIDINTRENWWKKTPALYGSRGCVRELVEIANRLGFFWGGHYSGNKDGMHFELAKL
ncbi:MAG: M15 family metallopeptidase [Pseudomonadota bacterium]